MLTTVVHDTGPVDLRPVFNNQYMQSLKIVSQGSSSIIIEQAVFKTGASASLPFCFFAKVLDVLSSTLVFCVTFYTLSSHILG